MEPFFASITAFFIAQYSQLGVPYFSVSAVGISVLLISTSCITQPWAYSKEAKALRISTLNKCASFAKIVSKKHKLALMDNNSILLTISSGEAPT